jgi:thiamine kinase-like enzyme
MEVYQLAHQFQPLLARYVAENQSLQEILDLKAKPVSLTFLAAGENNLAFKLSSPSESALPAWVLRFCLIPSRWKSNVEQIAYEYKTLEYLKGSGITAEPCYLDLSCQRFPYPLMGMTFLPGRMLNYDNDLARCARIYAQLHAVTISDEKNHLLKNTHPLTLYYRESLRFAQKYLACRKGDPLVKRILEFFIRKAEIKKDQEPYLLSQPVNGINHIDATFNNWLIDESQDRAYVVDWEWAEYGTVAGDLSHFLCPTLVYRHNRYILSEEQRIFFLKTYFDHCPDKSREVIIREHLRLVLPFIVLRSTTWAASVMVDYLEGTKVIERPESLRKVKAHLELDFLEWLKKQYFED